MDCILKFIELDITSNFTFLAGGSHPEEYADRAASFGMDSFAISDVNSVAGIVRAHRQCVRIALNKQSTKTKELSVSPRLIPATKLILENGICFNALAPNRKAWGKLSRLISKGCLSASKGQCKLNINDVLEFGSGLILLLHPHKEMLHGRDCPNFWIEKNNIIINAFGNNCYFLMSPLYDGKDKHRFEYLSTISKKCGIPTIASASPIMHTGTRRKLMDVLTCIRKNCKIDSLGHLAQINSEKRMRNQYEILQIFKGFEDSVYRTGEISNLCHFSLKDLSQDYPSEVNEGTTPKKRLRNLAKNGLKWRYPGGPTSKVKKMLEYELTLISKLKYESYFLTVNDIVAFARSKNILCQGRGSAANSVVCYCLGITSVSPEIGTMVFERFVSEARNEPPDIDVDFEHDRREEVIQYIYGKYGRHRAGLCATVIHYRGKGAIREVGKAMGLSENTITSLSSQIWGFGSSKGIDKAKLIELGFDPYDSRLSLTLKLIKEIEGFPRHMSQHVGGFIITDSRLDELVPIENATMDNRTIICWDKDDIDTLGILKVDILSLGMLTCLQNAFGLLKNYYGLEYNLSTLPPNSQSTYKMLSKGDSLGVFQVESRAQMNFLPRMKPKCFYDLVIQVAIVRPGPIQGDMVHPFLKRRNGLEKVTFPSDALGKVLQKTLGVPLFQEQAMQIAIIGAGFTPAEADDLRRSLAAFKKNGDVSSFRTRFIKGMILNGYTEDFSHRCFSQIEGFGSYGFPESHAASFALLVYASAWLKYHYPEIFACALLNSQPMGFYAPAQIVRDAIEHKVIIKPLSIKYSYWNNTLETDGNGGFALRLGLRQIKSMPEEDANFIIGARGNGYLTIEDISRRTGASPHILTILANADAFYDLGITRRKALWDIKALHVSPQLPLFEKNLEGEGVKEVPEYIPKKMHLGENLAEDYASMQLSLRAHPLALLRKRLSPP